jgi:Right handed beta helix region
VSTRPVLSLAFVLVTALSGACAPNQYWNRYQFYVSTDGSDALGDGSETRPWRSIAFAVDYVSAYQGFGIPRIYVASGSYKGKLRINRSLQIFKWRDDGKPVDVYTDAAIVGGGAGACWGGCPSDDDYVVKIAGGGSVTLDGIRIDGAHSRYPGILVRGARAYLYRVQIVQPWAHGVQIFDSPEFEIDDLKIAMTVGSSSYPADIGVGIQNSSGTISRADIGDRFDHVIDVVPGSDFGESVAIRNSRITGSRIYYGEGIRIRGPVDIVIENNSLYRPTDSEPARPPAAHERPSGISVGFPAHKGKLALIRNNVVAGFNVGITLDVTGNRVRIQDNTLSGLFADVETMPCCRGPGEWGTTPVVDLGGGALSSPGGNRFYGPASGHAFYHRAAYDVPAHGNDWVTTGPSQIDSRIWDKIDDPALGRVRY